ncbi:MAG: DUF3788 domain-containing protein [Treponema sp.]|nr:DUF3788 domain-containing protein [Treponema sp.]MCL2250548.1 DUF3788 domain-containing protein [Treponema sp.]
METQILTDPMIKPNNKVLETALGKNFKRFMEFLSKIGELNLVPEWNYYNDGKSWLCKILNKKKNLAWLSVWNTGFKLSFFFTEKTIAGVYELDIDDEIKTIAKDMKPTGKLLPVVFLIKNKKMLSAGLRLLEYKMRLK